MKIMPWKRDKWNSTDGNYLRYDKLEHFIRDYLSLLLGLYKWGFNIWLFVGWAAFIILWEVKDGMVPYDGVHIQGFSIKDALAGFIGGFFAIITYVVVSDILWAI